MHRDTVIGIVGVVILVAAMVGVFTYERGQASELGGGSTVLANLTGPSLEGTTAVGATTEEIVTINQTGLTNVTFTLRWTAGSGADTMRLRVAPSNATQMTTGAESDAEDDGEITLTIPVPNTGSNGNVGVGDWQVTVEFVSATAGLPVPVEPPVGPAAPDTEVAWTLGTGLQAYDASAGDDS